MIVLTRLFIALKMVSLKLRRKTISIVKFDTPISQTMILWTISSRKIDTPLYFSASGLYLVAGLACFQRAFIVRIDSGTAASLKSAF